MELMEINEKETIKNAKKKLREYPRWREIAHDSAEQRITANYTFKPRSKNNNRSNIVETPAVRRMNASKMSWKLLRKHTETSLINATGLLSIAVSYNTHQHQTGLSVKNWVTLEQDFKS